MEAGIEGKHFVLVHGSCHGAWCWYKLIPLLKKAGHRVTSLDMAASGINIKSIKEVCTFEQYNKPLLDFMARVEERVILVGHSFGGMNIAMAMEKFPHRISAAVFLTAFVPNYSGFDFLFTPLEVYGVSTRRRVVGHAVLYIWLPRRTRNSVTFGIQLLPEAIFTFARRGKQDFPSCG